MNIPSQLLNKKTNKQKKLWPILQKKPLYTSRVTRVFNHWAMMYFKIFYMVYIMYLTALELLTIFGSSLIINIFKGYSNQNLEWIDILIVILISYFHAC